MKPTPSLIAGVLMAAVALTVGALSAQPFGPAMVLGLAGLISAGGRLSIGLSLVGLFAALGQIHPATMLWTSVVASVAAGLRIRSCSTGWQQNCAATAVR